MKRFLVVSIVAIMTTLLVFEHCFAGLINYRRRNRDGGGAAAPTGTPAKGPTHQWLSTLPVPKSKTEQKYDVNKDGKLQTAETTIFLRDVLDTIDSKGGYPIDSDILKEYDKNKDGVINRYEATDIRLVVR